MISDWPIFWFIVVPYTNYTNLTLGKKFQNFMELHTVMELYVFFSQRTSYTGLQTYNSTTVHGNSFALLHTVALDRKFQLYNN